MTNTTYQLSFEDIEKQNRIANELTRYAFIDECGSFGFDFAKENTSKYFVLCAVIIQASKLQEVSDIIAEIRRKRFSNGEMKSSSIGSDDKRRSALLTELLPLDFTVELFIADKEEFQKVALKEYKPTFYKYMHRMLYDCLYLIYPKLKIYADDIGDEEFRDGFKKYVENNRPKYNIFNEYAFDFTDSKDSNFVQVSDIIAGSIMRNLTCDRTPDYKKILSGKIQHISYYPNKGLPTFTSEEEKKQFNEPIYNLSVDLASRYITHNLKSEEKEVRLRVGFLKILLFEVQDGNPFQYVPSYQILKLLNEYVEFKVSRDFLYRQIVAPLRDEKVIIASSPQGYKVPVSAADIITYFHQTNAIVSPMLHRIELCRDLIRGKTNNELDILDCEPFIKYKKYFD